MKLFVRSLASMAASAAITTALAATSASAAPVARPAHQLQQGLHRNLGQWVPTQTQNLQLTKPFTDLGSVAPTMQMNVGVALQPTNLGAARSLLAHMTTPNDPQYNQFITEQQWNANFAPSQSEVTAVTSYLSSMGFQNIAVTPNNLIVTASAPASVVETAFNVSIHNFLQNANTYYGPFTHAYVPSSLSGAVTAVLGLNDIPANRYLVRQRSQHRSLMQPNGAPPCQQVVNGLCVLNSYNALGFLTAYDGLKSPTAKNTSIAVFSEGDLTQTLKDLRQFEKENNLPQVKYAVKQVTFSSTDTAGVPEWDIDSQSSTSIAGGQVKQLYFYNGSDLTDLSTSMTFNAYIHDGPRVAPVANASFGECEVFAVADGSIFVNDTQFLQMALQGQTLFSSAGDNGFTCPVAAATGVPGTGLPFQSYPSDSPYVVSVGGTSLITNANDGTYYTEYTWIGTGGGLSLIENNPPWQKTTFNQDGIRSVPDIAMDADPNTGILAVVNGADAGYGGTSLASPLSMGTYARLQTQYHNKLGNAGSELYNNYAAWGGYSPPTPGPGQLYQMIGGFHDILIGANGTYPALPGYDLTTGMGTFDIGQFFKYFKP